MSARYRGPSGDPAASSSEPSKPIKKVADDTTPPSSGFSVLDVLRVIGGILILVTGTSYLATSGESMTWGYNAWWTRAREWKALIVRAKPNHYFIVVARPMVTAIITTTTITPTTATMTL